MERFFRAALKNQILHPDLSPDNSDLSSRDFLPRLQITVGYRDMIPLLGNKVDSRLLGCLDQVFWGYHRGNTEMEGVVLVIGILFPEKFRFPPGQLFNLIRVGLVFDFQQHNVRPVDEHHVKFRGFFGQAHISLNVVKLNARQLECLFYTAKEKFLGRLPGVKANGRQLGTYAVQLSESFFHLFAGFILKLAELVHLDVEFLTRFSLGLAEFADLLAGFSLGLAELFHLYVEFPARFSLGLAELFHLDVEFLTRFSLGLAEFADLLAGFSLKFTELVHLDVEFPARFSLGLAELVHLDVEFPARFSLGLAELVHLYVEFPARFSLGLAELVHLYVEFPARFSLRLAELFHLDVEFPARFSLGLAKLINSLENILYVEFLSHNKNIQNGRKYVKGIYLKFSMPSKSVGTSELKSELVFGP